MLLNEQFITQHNIKLHATAQFKICLVLNSSLHNIKLHATAQFKIFLVTKKCFFSFSFVHWTGIIKEN